VIYAIEANSALFQKGPFRIYTDHVSNTFVKNLKHSHGKLYRWSLRLQGYNFEIQHISGNRMITGFLSRSVDTTDETAKDLDDDSCLVFANTQPDMSDATTATPCPARRHKFAQSHRRTAVINWPTRISTLDNSVGAESLPTTQYSTDAHMTCQNCHHSNKTSPFTLESHDGNPDFHQIAADMAVKPLNSSFANPTDSQAMCSITSPVATSTPDTPVLQTSIKQQDPTLTTATTPDQTHINISSLSEFTDTQRLAKLQRESHDLSEIIQLLENHVLPSNNNRARKLMADIDSWTLVGGILYHIYNPAKRNVNSVKPILQQLAVPQSLRSQILTSFHDRLGHFRLDKCYMTIIQHYYWPGLYADLHKHLQKCEAFGMASQRPHRVTLYSTHHFLESLRS